MYVNPYFLCIFPVMMFITSGKRIRITILLYYVILTYDMMALLCMRLDLYLYAALWSFLYLGHHHSEFINNQTHCMGKTREDTFPHSFTPLFFRLVMRAFDNPQDVQESMLLLPSLLNAFLCLV